MLVFFKNLSLMKFQVRYLVLFALSSSNIHGPTLFLLYINDLHDDAIYTDDTTLYSKCDQASDLWQQLEMASELEYDLRDIGLGLKWLVYFNAGKTQLVLSDQSNNAGAIDVKMDGSALVEKSSLTFSSKLDWDSCIISIAKTTFKTFFLLRLPYISINPLYSHAWNTAVMSGLKLLAAAWTC